MAILGVLGVLGVCLMGFCGALGCPSPPPAPTDASIDSGRDRDLAASADLFTRADLAADLATPRDLLPARNSGDCNDDRDCAGGLCVELSPGGFRVCKQPVPEATACSSPRPGFDECCKTAECAAGNKCLEWPLSPYCGGAFPVPHNVCASDGCKSSADCAAPAVCVPAGALGYKVSACLDGGCRTDRDCTARPGGICAPIQSPCCGGTLGLACVYPGDGCRNRADCPGGYCDIDRSAGETRGKCKTGVPICPA